MEDHSGRSVGLLLLPGRRRSQLGWSTSTDVAKHGYGNRKYSSAVYNTSWAFRLDIQTVNIYILKTNSIKLPYHQNFVTNCSGSSMSYCSVQGVDLRRQLALGHLTTGNYGLIYYVVPYCLVCLPLMFNPCLLTHVTCKWKGCPLHMGCTIAPLRTPLRHSFFRG